MTLTLCLTQDCNLRCGYCYAGRKERRTMSREVARAGIRFGLEQAAIQNTNAAPPRLQLGFFGGEPLLEWDLLRWSHEEAVVQAAQAGVVLDFTVTTNLTLLDADKAHWLRDRRYFLGLSLDGNEAMHDTWRVDAAGRGSHADCVRALAHLRGYDAAELICVVDPANLRHLADSVAWMAETFDWKIALNLNFAADWDEAALALLTHEYHRVGDVYLRRYRDGHPVRINVLDGKIRTHLQHGYRDCDKCSMGERELAVAASGNLYPCARLVGDDDRPELRIGDVRSGFDALRRLHFLTHRGNRNPACDGCPVRERCMNWCGCVNHVTSQGRTDHVGPFTCFHEKLSIEVADRVAETLWNERNPAFLRAFYGQAGLPHF